MASSEPSTRLFIRGGDDRGGIEQLAKHGLGLTEAEARRFAAAGDRTVALFRPPRDELDSLTGRCRRLGAEVRAERPGRDGQPCPRHPRLAELDVCPRCGERRVCDACLRFTREGACPSCQRRARRGRAFKAARVGLLLAVLAAIASAQWLGQRRISSWTAPLRVLVMPVLAAPETAGFARELAAADLAPLERFLAREARRHALGFAPRVSFAVGPPLARPPPDVPEAPGALDAIAFSLRLRWWVLTEISFSDLPEHDVRLALVLHPPQDGATLPHSAGLARGRVGVVHAFASRELLGVLRVVAVHELLHIAGASDKYGPDGAPAFPEGYVDPGAGPGPRPTAEVMAGTRIGADGAVKLPQSLEEVGVGTETAREIGWIEGQSR